MKAQGRRDDKLSKFATKLRKLRRRACLPYDVSIYTSNDELHLSSDSGALLRPLVISEKREKFLKVASRPVTDRNRFEELVSEGVVEFLDSSETKNSRIAINFSDVENDPSGGYTHVEIHPSLVSGICVSLIPFANHNQSPRIAYQAAQCKQAIGTYTTTFNDRLDTIAHVLVNPQRGLVTTRYEEMFSTKMIRSGSMPIVAIMTYSGFNQDDSVILNKSSVERGLFHSYAYHTYREEEKTSGADVELFENPKKIEGCRGIKQADYSKLGDDGLPLIGMLYRNGDVLIGKTIAMSTLQTDNTTEVRRSVKRDRSLVLRCDEDVVVDAVLKTKSSDGNNYVKVRTRSLRIPIVGDKFSARHGQKGVCGIMLDDADMPFSKETGVRPDLVVNPHALPSRMTLAMLLEQLLGKLSCLDGDIKDGTMFSDLGLEEIASCLEKHGYDKYGSETMICGFTGKELSSKVFIAPCFYQRLKHMVVDKMHGRSRGAKQLLTRAPTEGRSREGGLRVGEMEKDSICSWGGAHILLDRLVEQSDAFTCSVCSRCGEFVSNDNDDAAAAPPNCKMCRCSLEGAPSKLDIQIPFSMKLLLQEIRSCGVDARLRLE